MKDKKFSVLWDMDIPTADWELGFKRVFEKRFPDIAFIEPQHRKNWWMSLDYPPELKSEIDAIAFEPGFFENLPVKPGVIEALQWTLAQGFKVSICTSPLWTADAGPIGRCIAEKAIWLAKHISPFASLFTPQADIQVVFAHDKSLIHGDVLIDDNPSIHCSIRPTWKQLLFDENYLFSKDSKLQKINWQSHQEILSHEFRLWKQKQETSQ